MSNRITEWKANHYFESNCVGCEELLLIHMNTHVHVLFCSPVRVSFVKPRHFVKPWAARYLCGVCAARKLRFRTK